MHLKINDNSASDPIFDSLYPWRENGFFIATVGEEAYSYLSGQIFNLSNLDCCSPAIFVNVKYFSDYKRWIDDDNEALQRMEADTRALAKSCEKKQLYVMSEAEDLYTANQCCELANSTGKDGFSILITHQRVKAYPYFSNIKEAFEHIIFLPNEATYTTEILKWIICDFTAAGYIGVDFDDARYVLTRTSESVCRKIKYESFSELKKGLGAFLSRGHIACNPEQERNHLLGLTVPRDFSLEDVDFVFEELSKASPGTIVISCLGNSDEGDTSWSVSLLSAVANKEPDDDTDDCIEEFLSSIDK